MRTENHQLNLNQERLRYKRAVRLSLEVFFEKNRRDSEKLVSAWWKRLGTAELFKTGLFMHDEPINVAANLINAPVPEIRSIHQRYEKVLSDAMPKSRLTPKLPKSVTTKRRAA